MKELYHVPQVIATTQITAAKYPNVSSFIKPRDFVEWQQKLEKSIDLENDLYGGPTFNLLKLLVGAGLEERYKELPRYSTQVINNLEHWLGLFPQLARDKRFPGKLKNLDRDSFMSTLSELLIAAHFRELGLAVEFEHKFTVPTKKGKPDIDLTVTNFQGAVVHIEVYSPFLPAENGFVNFENTDEAFSKKVAFKMDDKFGQAAVSGLNGKVILAVDTLKADMLKIRAWLTDHSSDNLYVTMAKHLPVAVDGYLFYHGNITSKEVFVFEKLILKN